MNRIIDIGGRLVGEQAKPFIIAELSGNHQRSFAVAIKMIEAAAASGADAIKLQTYTADSMTLNLSEGEFVIAEKESLWHGRTLHSLYQEAATPYEWHEKLFAKAKALGMLAFSSPFDEDAVDFLESLNVPCYKIASFENTDLPLIRKVAATGKPVIVSTGMASLSEIDELVATVKKAGGKNLILLKCTSTYPAPPGDCNLMTIPHMRQTFGCPVGLSDHTQGVGTALAAIALGASVVEKHFVLSRSDGGVDAAFSMEPEEMKQLVQEADSVYQALGAVCYGDTVSDKIAKVYRRSLYVVRDIAAGDIVTKNNVRPIRPGYGLAPKYWDCVLGKTVRSDISKGTPLSWEHF